MRVMRDKIFFSFSVEG